MTVLYVYLVLINIAAFAAMCIDKIKARQHRWRIPESTLLLLALPGGSIGAIAGMLLFRHKIRDKKFSLGLPVMLLIHLIIAVAVIILQG